jgi:hypothetical protein
MTRMAMEPALAAHFPELFSREWSCLTLQS